MREAVLQEVQTALLERDLDAQPRCALADAEPTFLPSILTDYLDTLLRAATEIPESRMAQFACLRFVFGNYQLLMPLSRIQRLDLATKLRRRFRLRIPGYEGGDRFMMKLAVEAEWFYFDDLLGLEVVKSDDVIWRNAPGRAPWFVGTHKRLLCRVFDPDLLIETR
ncbi:MAG: hypothetical protein ACJAXW_004070 [Candidatus Azotimanducaceae bacterium]|jgi:hypothetical protein